MCLNQVVSNLSDNIVSTHFRAALINSDTALAVMTDGTGREDHADVGEGEGRVREVGQVGAARVAAADLPALLFRSDVWHAFDELTVGS